MLKYRELKYYQIYTECCTNKGISRQQLIEAAETTDEVLFVEPYGINDELLVCLSHRASIEGFIEKLERKLINLLK